MTETTNTQVQGTDAAENSAPAPSEQAATRRTRRGPSIPVLPARGKSALSAVLRPESEEGKGDGIVGALLVAAHDSPWIEKNPGAARILTFGQDMREEFDRIVGSPADAKFDLRHAGNSSTLGTYVVVATVAEGGEVTARDADAITPLLTFGGEDRKPAPEVKQMVWQVKGTVSAPAPAQGEQPEAQPEDGKPEGDGGSEVKDEPEAEGEKPAAAEPEQGSTTDEAKAEPEAQRELPRPTSRRRTGGRAKAGSSK